MKGKIYSTFIIALFLAVFPAISHADIIGDVYYEAPTSPEDLPTVYSSNAAWYDISDRPYFGTKFINADAGNWNTLDATMKYTSGGAGNTVSEFCVYDSGKTLIQCSDETFTASDFVALDTQEKITVHFTPAISFSAGQTYYIMHHYVSGSDNQPTWNYCDTFSNGGCREVAQGQTTNHQQFSSWYTDKSNFIVGDYAVFALRLYNTSGAPTDVSTRIIDFNPQNNSTTTGPTVDFDLHAYINPADLTTIRGVKVTLHNIDQNVLLLGAFSPSDIYLFEGQATTSGDFYFATSSIPLGDGNYRLEACLERTYFQGWLQNPFSPINDCQSHQFIVGEATFIGNISQTLFTETNDFYAGLTATSSEALASTCNPLNSNFGIRECSAYLFIPDGNSLKQTMDNARSGIFSRVPWGYVTRVVNIIQNPATTTLPTWTSTIQIGPGDDMTPDTTELSFDVGDMIAGGGELLDSIEDPNHGMTAREIFYPLVQLGVALMVLLTILSDITKSHGHAGESRPATKLS